MRNRWNWGRDQILGTTSRLEARSLPSGGLAGLSHIIQNLGTVTGSAATSGVEATALIAAQSSVTFRFAVQDAGQYTLLVRHVGQGLTLQAKTPGGTAAVEPGVAGPFQVVPLRLETATYEITAAAEAGESVYVDWELLLNSGVSQSANETTTATTLIPLSFAAPSLSTPANLTPAPVGSSASSTGSLSPPVESTEPASSPIYLASGPVGRPSLDAPSPPPLVALMPGTTDRDLASSMAELDSALLIAMQASSQDEGSRPEKSEDHSWFDDFWGTAAETPDAEAEPTTPEAGLARMMAESIAPATKSQKVSLATISPGLALGALAVTVAARSRIKGNPRLPQRSTPAHPSASRTDSSLQRLRAIFERSYRPGRCRPVRPLRPAR